MSVGVNVTIKVCIPAPRTVPAAGEYANVPGVLALAFNWAPLKAVPYVMAAGVVQEILGLTRTGGNTDCPAAW